MIPHELMQEIKSNNCVPFIGAGVSTEASYTNATFYDHIRQVSKYPDKGKRPLFPDLMQYYCDKVDGGRKNRLIREIIDWIEPFCLEGEPNRSVAMFHTEMARIPYFRVFITTNWDPLCERALDVLVPMVEDRDIPFWVEDKRQVLKIHGCVTRPQTIIATRRDYEVCMTDKKQGAIFTRLRDLMATKTFIFIGYSITDPDFKAIYDDVIMNLGEFRRCSYVIAPTPSGQTAEDWRKRGVRIVKMSGIAFARQITRHLENQGIILTDELLGHFHQQFYRIGQIHMETCEKQDTDIGFASSMYQDGLLHSLEDIIRGSKIGKTFDEFKNDLEEYEKTLQECQKNEALVEIAYYKGRIEVLRRLIARNRRDIPPLLHPERLQPMDTKKAS